MEQNSNETQINNDRLTVLEQKVDYLVSQARAASTARKITLILTILFVVLPVVLLMFVLPSAMESLTASYSI